jgi:hypothetical protein
MNFDDDRLFRALMLNSKIGFVSILVGLAGIATTVIAIFAQ